MKIFQRLLCGFCLCGALLTVGLNTATAQCEGAEGQTIFRQINPTAFQSVFKLPGGYLLAGYDLPGASGSGVLVRVDDNFEVEATNRLGQTLTNPVYYYDSVDVQLMMGYTRAGATAGLQLASFNPFTGLDWSVNWEGSVGDVAGQISRLDDGDYLFTGTLAPDTDPRAFAARISENGAVQWARTYSDSISSAGAGTQLDDGAIVIAGSVSSAAGDVYTALWRVNQLNGLPEASRLFIISDSVFIQPTYANTLPGSNAAYIAGIRSGDGAFRGAIARISSTLQVDWIRSMNTSSSSVVNSLQRFNNLFVAAASVSLQDSISQVFFTMNASGLSGNQKTFVGDLPQGAPLGTQFVVEENGALVVAGGTSAATSLAAPFQGSLLRMNNCFENNCSANGLIGLLQDAAEAFDFDLTSALVTPGGATGPAFTNGEIEPSLACDPLCTDTLALRDTIGCAGQSLPFPSDFTGFDSEFFWYWYGEGINSNQPGTTGIFANNPDTVTVRLTLYNDDCAYADTAQIEFLGGPQITGDSDVFQLCAGDTLDLEYVLSPYTTVLWSPSAGLSDTASAELQAFPSSTTIYNALLDNGCSTDDFPVAINVSAPVALGFVFDTVVCRNTPFTLIAQGNGVLNWRPEDALLTPTLTNTEAQIEEDTRFILENNLNGCIDRDTLNITVFEEIAGNYLGLVDLLPGEPINYDSLERVYRGQIIQPPLPPEPDNDMRYQLTMIDSNGCRQLVEIDTRVNVIFYAPTAFTPNGDEFNNLWRIEHAGDYRFFSLEVYDNYGFPLFRSDDPDEYWNGAHPDGSTYVSPGVYNWRMEYELKDARTFVKTGFVTVLR